MEQGAECVMQHEYCVMISHRFKNKLQNVRYEMYITRNGATKKEV